MPPEDTNKAVPAESGTRLRRRAFSGLTGRILALNILALAMLVGGILYVNQFRTGLVQTRLSVLVSEAEMVAAALGESATGGADAISVDVDRARPILQRLISGEGNRARLFSIDGSLMLDSRNIIPNSQVRETPLKPPEDSPGIRPLWDRIKGWFIRLVSSLPDYPAYMERVDQQAEDYPEVTQAFLGEIAVAVRQTDDETLMLHAAIPVQRLHRVLGAVLVSAETTEIEEVVRQERLAILEVFGIALIVTALLSLLLAGTIARPVRRLADFAHQVRQGRGREVKMPDFTTRQDELGDLSRALKEMTRALYRRIDAIEAFAADVSHELKNPISSMHSAIETLDLDGDPEQQRKLLDILKSDIGRLDRLISDISNASRLDAELLRGDMTPFDLGEMLETITEVYEETALPEDMTISLIIPDEEMNIAGIDSHIAQVIRNLLDNAISFNTSGGTITIQAQATDTRIQLTVDDQGPGVDEDKLESIFDRFYSERPEAEDFGNHSGLGLNICKQIIAIHSGEIWAENIYAEGDQDQDALGARFVVSLPQHR